MEIKVSSMQTICTEAISVEEDATLAIEESIPVSGQRTALLEVHFWAA